MTVRYLLVASCIFLIACQSVERLEKPERLLSEDQMCMLLIDIAFVKAAKVSQKKLLETHKFDPERYILKKHGIDSITFAKSNAWYATDLKTYERIFSCVKNDLENSKTEYKQLKKKEDSIQKKSTDSINKLKTLKKTDLENK